MSVLRAEHAQDQLEWYVYDESFLPTGSMLTAVALLKTLLSRVADAQSRLKLCCIAFADMCCATSRTADGCCESSCDSDDVCSMSPLATDTYRPDPSIRHLEKADLGISPDSTTSKEEEPEEIVLEVIGMDCPDCLSKVIRAVKVLAGADVINGDGVRGLVRVQYDSSELLFLPVWA